MKLVQKEKVAKNKSWSNLIKGKSKLSKLWLNFEEKYVRARYTKREGVFRDMKNKNCLTVANGWNIFKVVKIFYLTNNPSWIARKTWVSQTDSRVPWNQECLKTGRSIRTVRTPQNRGRVTLSRPREPWTLVLSRCLYVNVWLYPNKPGKYNPVNTLPSLRKIATLSVPPQRLRNWEIPARQCPERIVNILF